MNPKNTNQPTNPAPRYPFCWWCSIHLRGSTYRLMQRAEPANDGPVSVHVGCMPWMDDDGWEEVVTPIAVTVTRSSSGR